MKARLTAALPGLLVLAGCLDDATTPSVAVGSEFQLRPSESVSVETTDLSVRFELVTGDSRCPADAICVWQGDATAVFSVKVGAASSTSLTLHTTGEGRRGSADGFTLTLVRLDPYPYSSRPISLSDYRAQLRVDPAFDR
jgi:hypothetical protein